MTTYEANPRDVGSLEWGELGRFSAACSRVSHQMSSNRVPHPRPRPFEVTLGGVYAWRSTPRNAHRGPSRRFLAADVPRQPTGQPGPVRFHGVTLRLRRNPRLPTLQRTPRFHRRDPLGVSHLTDVPTFVAAAISVLIVD